MNGGIIQHRYPQAVTARPIKPLVTLEEACQLARMAMEIMPPQIIAQMIAELRWQESYEGYLIAAAWREVLS